METGAEDKELGTLIRLPFNYEESEGYNDFAQEEAFKRVQKELVEDLAPTTLLFLKKIRKIEWETPNPNGGPNLSGGWEKDSTEKKLRIKTPLNIKVFNIKLKPTKNEHNTDVQEYVVFRRRIEINHKELCVEAAFKLGKRKKLRKPTVVAERDKGLIVLFPTKKVTHLNFLIQGPYRTIPSREGVSLDGNEQNKEIVVQTGELVADSLLAIKGCKDIENLYADFLSVLPIDPPNERTKENFIYTTLYNKVKEKLLSGGKSLPISGGGYASPRKSLIATGEASEWLLEHLNKTDIQRLYSKEFWVDTKIATKLRNYLIAEIKVESIAFETFVESMRDYGTAKFLGKKQDSWMIDFYSELLGHESLWKQGRVNSRYEYDPFLRYEPIIKLSTGGYVVPFELLNGVESPRVYLPTKKMFNYDTVKSSLVTKGTGKFLEELGLTTPNIVTKVTELILPKYKKGIDTPDDQYFNDFKDILKAYENIPNTEKKRLKNTRFVLAIENLTGKEILKAPNETYFRTTDLGVFFEGYEHAYFVSEKLLKGDEKIEILKRLGVEDKPRRIEINDGLTLEEKQYLRGYGRLADEEIKNYEYDGLENFIKRGMNAPKSYLLWKLLLESIRNFSYSQDEFRRYQIPGRFFDGKYRKMPQSQWGDWKSFPSNFTKLLRNSDWLVDKTGKFRKPSDIRRSELAQGYVMAHHYSEELQALENELKLKPYIPPPPDPIYQLQKDEQEKLKLLRKYPNMSISRIEEILSDASKSQNENQTPESETDENIPDTPIRRMKKPILKIRPASVPSIHPTPGPNPKPNQPRKEANSTDKKESGWKVEKRVFETLKNEEEFEVVWLNEDEERGIGCDFHVKRGDEIIKYIEVKSKTEEDPKEVIMTGAQWHLALEQGNKILSLCCVKHP